MYSTLYCKLYTVLSYVSVDIAVELSYHAAQVYISTRSGCYVMTRLGHRGLPIDFGVSRANEFIPPSMLKFHPALVNNKVDFKTFGLEPTGTLGIQKFPIVNDNIQHRIITGSIQVKGNVKEITRNSVIIEGGETLENIDALVFATGFKQKYPFAKEIIEVKDDFYISLYKHIFLPNDEQHTLAVIGAVGVGGPVPPVSEMQARVAAEVFAKRCRLPSQDKMEKEISKREKSWLETGTNPYNFMRVSMVAVYDEMVCCLQWLGVL